MKIKLLGGYKYKFVCALIVNGKNILYSNSTGGYGSPFTTINGSVAVTNSFKYSSSEFLYTLASSGATLKDQTSVTRPEFEKYYGTYTGYIPAENGSVSIEMKKALFGIKVIADGLSEGKLKITLDQHTSHYITFPSTEIKYKLVMNMDNPMLGKEDTDTALTEIFWEKQDGSSILLMSKRITYKRNKLTTITVKVKDNSISNGMDISKENSNMTNGDRYIVDENGEIITDISPQG